MQEECLLDEPVEFWGGLQLLRSLNQFFDRALYFSLIGYQEAGNTLVLEGNCESTERYQANQVGLS